jgi:hypothetical protein
MNNTVLNSCSEKKNSICEKRAVDLPTLALQKPPNLVLNISKDVLKYNQNGHRRPRGGHNFFGDKTFNAVPTRSARTESSRRAPVIGFL